LFNTRSNFDVSIKVYFSTTLQKKISPPELISPSWWLRAFFSSDFFCDRTFFAKVAQVAVFEVVDVKVQGADQS
jgi:hypothetical protein